jgi:hypothetical protein
MAEAMYSGLEALARFAGGLQDDLVAIKTGLTLEGSNGVTEGQLPRLKLVTRQGYRGPASRSCGSASCKWLASDGRTDGIDGTKPQRPRGPRGTDGDYRSRLNDRAPRVGAG